MERWIKLFAALVMIATASAVSFGQSLAFPCYEGYGTIENNWADLSWSTIHNPASSAYHFSGSPGANSYEVQYGAAYQGFSLELSAPVPASYFSSLQFYINGGAVAGRAINVSVNFNGTWSPSLNLNRYIQGGYVPANSWALASIPLTAFGATPSSLISQFTLQEAAGTAQPPFYLAQIGWTAVTTANIIVNPSKIIRPVPQEIFGINTATWQYGLDSALGKRLSAQAGYHAMRYPGGSTSDEYFYNQGGQNMNFDQFADLASTTNGHDVITVNYGSGQASDAANWVYYSNVVKKYGFKYWEIGNECYGAWENDTHAKPHDPITYANQFAQFYKAMKAVDPSIQIGAVVTPWEDSYANYPASESVVNPVTGIRRYGWTPIVLSTLKSLNVTPDFVIHHNYPEYEDPYYKDCDFTLLTTGVADWRIEIQNLRDMLTDYMGASTTANTKIQVTEVNTDPGDGSKQLVSLVDGLFLADTFGALLQTECASMYWFAFLSHSYSPPYADPWVYGWRTNADEGVVSTDFTQQYPAFTMETLLNLFTQANDSVIGCTSYNGLLSSYATSRSDGSVRVLVVNKTSSTPMTTTLNFQNYKPTGQATIATFGIPQDSAVQYGSPSTIGQSQMAASAQMRMTFPPYSATVITVY